MSERERRSERETERVRKWMSEGMWEREKKYCGNFGILLEIHYTKRTLNDDRKRGHSVWLHQNVWFIEMLHIFEKYYPSSNNLRWKIVSFSKQYELL